MKFKAFLPAMTLSAFATSAALAAVSYPTDDTVWKPEPSKATKAEAKKAEVKKPVKKHSHVEEKTGMPAPQHSAIDKNASRKRKDAHDHTRDRH